MKKETEMKRYFSKTVTLAAALAFCGTDGANADNRPNIVFIMADDHNRQAISAYHERYKEVAPTPNIDRLAGQGILFERMAVPNSVCVPARANLITGKHSHLNGVRINSDRFDGSQQTFPKLLQEAGYATAVFGKWHLHTQPTGFDHYAVVAGQGRFHNCPFLKTGGPWGDEGRMPSEGYLTDLLSDKAIAWMEQKRNEGPFIVMIHHKAPHTPHHPAPRHQNFLEGVVLPEPDNLLDDYAGRAIREVKNELTVSRLLTNQEGSGYREMAQKWSGQRDEGTRAIYQEFMKGYLRLVKSLDENVGRVLDYLDASGLGDNTVVIYTSDNGFFNGEHGLYNKMWMYEESMMIPMIARWPGVIQPGSRTGELASMLDFAPTFLEIAGAPVPEDMQGFSLLPLLRGEETPLRDALYYHFHGQSNIPQQLGVRTKDRKLVHYPGLEQVRWELFDLDSDPYEMRNLADHPECTGELKKMQDLLLQEANKYRDPAFATLEADLRNAGVADPMPPRPPNDTTP